MFNLHLTLKVVSIFNKAYFSCQEINSADLENNTPENDILRPYRLTERNFYYKKK
jgi:hypothetical protein